MAHYSASGPVVPTQRSIPSCSCGRSGDCSVVVPAGFAPDGFACAIPRPTSSAACTLIGPTNPVAIRENTEVGAYQPLPYLLPAAVLRIDHHTGGSLRHDWRPSRCGSRCSAHPGDLGALGRAARRSRASLNGSSLEIISSVAFFTSLLRLIRRGPTRASARAWLLAGAVGFVLALSRPPGPIWVVLDVALAALLAGARPTRSGQRSVPAVARRYSPPRRHSAASD